jgi:hypothetical protein
MQCTNVGSERDLWRAEPQGQDVVVVEVEMRIGGESFVSCGRALAWVLFA